MIKFIKHNDVDTEKWDKCIRKSVNCLPYAFSWYLDIVTNQWDALVLNDYEAVFPLPSKSKFKLTYSSTPFWVQQLGLFSLTCSSLSRINDFVDAIPDSYRFIDLNMNFNADVNQSSSIKIQTNNNYVIQLDKTYKEVKEQYSKNLSRNLKKSLTQNLQLFKNDSPSGLINLFRADRGKTIKHFSEEDYKRLETIMHVAIHKNCGQIWMAYGEGNRPLAGMFLLFSPTRVVMLFTGNSKEGKELGAMPFLIDSFLKESANSGLIFDFEGSNDLNLARFYKSFGAKNETYQNLKINRLPLLLKFLK
tara:strand:+ start:1759 stop:2673 length:915 start_codon:yes stop_codon:yes gene_type:complete